MQQRAVRLWSLYCWKKDASKPQQHFAENSARIYRYRQVPLDKTNCLYRQWNFVGSVCLATYRYFIQTVCLTFEVVEKSASPSEMMGGKLKNSSTGGMGEIRRDAGLGIGNASRILNKQSSVPQ